MYREDYKLLSTVEKAIAMATEAHAGQYDKSGQPYILHPLRLMFRFEGQAEMIVAVLHDVVEDSEISLEDLKEKGFSDEIVDAIDCLSKKEGEDYDNFILRVSENSLARTIKIEDLKDNLNVVRLKEVTDKDLQRIEKYHKALQRLSRC